MDQKPICKMQCVTGIVLLQAQQTSCRLLILISLNPSFWLTSVKAEARYISSLNPLAQSKMPQIFFIGEIVKGENTRTKLGLKFLNNWAICKALVLQDEAFLKKCQLPTSAKLVSFHSFFNFASSIDYLSVVKKLRKAEHNGLYSFT